MNVERRQPRLEVAASARAHAAVARPTFLPAVTVGIVYVVLVVAIPSRLIVGPIGAAGTPANLWGLFALLWWCCATIGGQNPIRFRSPVRLALAVLTVCVLLSYVAGMSRGWYAPTDVRQATDDVYDLVPVTLAQVRTAMIDAADRGLMSFGAWLGIALVVADGLRSWADVDRLVKWLTNVVGVVAIIGILQYFTGVSIASLFKVPGLVANYEFGAVDTRSVLRRVYATASHPIEFGVVMSATFPFAMHRFVHNRQSKVAAVAALAIGVAIPLSVSRSAILVVGVAMTVLFISWPAQWRRRLLAMAPVAMVGLRVAFPGVVGTIVALFTNLGNDPSVSGRTDDYNVALRVFADNPVLGRGLFTFVPRYYRILDNQLLMVMLELGLVGLVAVVGLAVTAAGCARGARRRTEDDAHKNLGLTICASIAGLFVSYATFDAWSFPMAAGMSFLLVGMAGAVWQVASRERWEAMAEADGVPALARGGG